MVNIGNYKDMFAVLIHIYYYDSWGKIFKDQLSLLRRYTPIIMVNLSKVCSDSALIRTIRADFPEAYIITTPNKGKDIGGKLALIDLFIKTEQNSKYIIFLHDKISPHSITGDRWREKLFRIINPSKVQYILKEYENQAKTGVIGANEFVTSEYNDEKGELETTNSLKIKELVKKYHLTVTDYTFIAGTMFWVRSNIIREFFLTYAPLSCREMLEEGDFTDQYEGTYTHSWERLFCWLASSQQYHVRGI